jgi:hypothetical protein
MDNAWRMLNDLVSNLTGVITGILGLGLVGALAFGDMGLGIDVIGNVTSLVETLASNGVVGLLVPAALMALVNR